MNSSIRTAILSLLLAAAPAPALAESFTYRGYLEDAGLPAEGRYDLTLAVYADAAGKHALSAPIELHGVPMTDGRFAVSVDIPGLPPHLERGWLEVAVKSPHDGAYWPLPERSEVLLKGAVCPASWALDGNAGTSASQNFVGTTDDVPLVLRSAAGIGINTSGVRGMLTVRGPDDFEAGPVIHLAGNSPSQFESGRIRFVNGTAAGNYRGFYLHYDGVGNRFHIGGRDSTGQDPAEDRNIITVRRSLPNRVGIGTDTPTSTLDVAGDIAVEGAVLFKGQTSHYLSLAVRNFNADNGLLGNNCRPRFGGLAKLPFQGDACGAHHNVHLPNGARIVRFAANFVQDGGAGGCSATLGRAGFDESLPPNGEVTVEVPPLNPGFPVRSVTLTSSPLNLPVNNRDQVVEVSILSREDFCAVRHVRIEYTLPNGFVP